MQLDSTISLVPLSFKHSDEIKFTAVTPSTGSYHFTPVKSIEPLFKLYGSTPHSDRLKGVYPKFEMI